MVVYEEVYGITIIWAINFTFIFFFSAISHLNVLSLKLTETASKPYPVVAMEQNHDHGKSLEKKLIARVANEQREKSNKCSLCDYASSHAGNLMRHLKTHSGEKSNKCNQCDYASIQAGDLKKHLKIHSGEKSNKCNQCEFASSRADTLRGHLKTHREEKPNANETCVINNHWLCILSGK